MKKENPVGSWNNSGSLVQEITMHGNQTDSLLGITITADGLINILEEVYIKKYAGIKKVNAVFIHLEEKAGCALFKLNYYLKRKIRQLVNQLLRDKIQLIP